MRAIERGVADRLAIDREPFRRSAAAERGLRLRVMISSAVIKLCEAVRHAGGRALLAGGWVRDFARGVESVDYDIEVYGLEATALRSMIEAHGKVDAVGEAFTVY